MIPIAAPDIGDREKARVRAVMDDGHIADGDAVRDFESAFAGYCGVSHGVATANGTAALHAALAALGIGPGDRVITTPFSFVATANAIQFVGADPVFADVDPRTLNLDPDEVEGLLREEPADAIVVVHLYGRPAPMDRFEELATAYDLALVGDAAQAHGAETGGRPVGEFGDAACYSYYPTKNMTTGEGGMVVTDRADVARAAARFVNHGRSDKYEHASLGHNFRMTSIAAAIGSVQLERLPAFNRARRRNAERFTAMLDGSGVQVPAPVDDGRHVYHQYTIRCADRDGLADVLDREGVETGIYYPVPIHRQPAYADVRTSAPVAERAAGRVLSLPVHPGVGDDDLRLIADAVAGYTGGGDR